MASIAGLWITALSLTQLALCSVIHRPVPGKTLFASCYVETVGSHRGELPSAQRLCLRSFHNICEENLHQVSLYLFIEVYTCTCAQVSLEKDISIVFRLLDKQFSGNIVNNNNNHSNIVSIGDAV